MVTKAKAEELISELDEQRKRVDVDNLDITVQELIRMAVEDELHRAPVYQRKFRWKVEDQSRLIESILLGLPIPTIYVAQNKDGKWDLVDGLQRLSTLIHFVEDSEEALAEINAKEPLTLGGLLELSTFNGYSFAELPPAIKLKFLKRPLRITALSDKAQYDVRFDVFERLNKGGITLSAQEVRACVFSGEFMEVLKSLATDEKFMELAKLKKVNQQDGTREELTLKFFAYLNDRSSFRHNVTEFLNGYAEKCVDNFDEEEMSRVFQSAVNALHANVKTPLIRDGSRVTSQVQLEAALVATAEILTDGDKIKKPHSAWLSDSAFVSSSSAGSNTPANLKTRVSRAKELLKGAKPELV